MPDMAPHALVFPGQGSHADGMEEPHRANSMLARGLELLGHDPFPRLDAGTRTQQPALFLCSVAAWAASSLAMCSACTLNASVRA